jgi:hypothetical protein
MLRIPHCLENRVRDGGEVVSPTTTILDIFHPPDFYERERERRTLGGGSERHYLLEGDVTET